MWEISLFWDEMIIVYRKAHFWTTFYIDIIQPNLSSFYKLYNVGDTFLGRNDRLFIKGEILLKNLYYRLIIVYRKADCLYTGI